MATIQEHAATVTEQAAQGLKRLVEAMPADRQTWRPLDEGRHALDQIQECAGANAMFAQALTQRAFGDFDPATIERHRAEMATMDKALAVLASATAGLVAAIRAFPDADLGKTITMPWGEQATFADILLFAYWNMTYHYGQISYIQTLYGDRGMH